MSPTPHFSYRHTNDSTRPRPVEVLIDGGRYTIVRRRETLEDLVAGETAV